MANKIDGIQPPFIPIGGVQGLQQQPKPLTSSENSPFKELLKAQLEKSEGMHFSAHAQSRMRSRNINLDADQLDKLTGAVDQARESGSRNALVLMEEYAFIVNAEKRTVITAMDRMGMDDNVITNIDSAVMV